MIWISSRSLFCFLISSIQPVCRHTSSWNNLCETLNIIYFCLQVSLRQNKQCSWRSWRRRCVRPRRDQRCRGGAELRRSVGRPSAPVRPVWRLKIWCDGGSWNTLNYISLCVPGDERQRKENSDRRLFEAHRASPRRASQVDLQGI